MAVFIQFYEAYCLYIYGSFACWLVLARLKYFTVGKALSRSQSEKTTWCMNPTIWHYGKGKTKEIIKQLVVTSGLEGGRDEQVKHRGLLGQWNYSVTIMVDPCRYTLSKPIDCTHQEWILMWTMNSGRWWNVNVGSSSASTVPLWCKILTKVRAEGVWKISVPSPSFCLKPKIAPKNKVQIISSINKEGWMGWVVLPGATFTN